jgi:putative DNA primase/helicase
MANRIVQHSPPARPEADQPPQATCDEARSEQDRAEYLARVRANVPHELRELRQWVVWKREPSPKDGKLTKVPYDPKRQGRKASSTNTSTWASFAVACAAYEGGGYDGLGFVFTASDPYSGVDVDHCRDVLTGELLGDARRIVDSFASYAEVSPSGDGVHVLVRAEMAEGSPHKRGDYEAYSAGRFFTITGAHIAGTPATVEERQEELEAFTAHYLAKPERARRQAGGGAAATGRAPLNLSDGELVQRALSAQNGATFAALWNGDRSGYASDSEADLALCRLLAFWTGYDAARMDRMFRASGLMREKWEREDYRQRTLSTVLATPGDTYDPNRRGTANAGTRARAGGGGGGGGGAGAGGGAAAGDQGEPDPEPGQRQAGGISAFNLTELGNAERLVARYGDIISYCYPWKRWLVWDGKRWGEDKRGQVTRLAKQTVRSIYAEVEAIEDDRDRRTLATHAQRSESDKALKAMMSLAQSERPVTPDELDGPETDWLLNCTNGVLDLRTSELHPHDRSRKITRITRVPYDPDAECPTWLTFLDRIMDGRADLIAYLQRAFGYSLTGSTREQVFFLPHGGGANGKSVLLSVMRDMLGDYAMQTSAQAFIVKHGDSIPNDLAALKGARLVTAVETEEGQRLAESLMKQLTGGDGEPISARFMHAEWFQYMPTYKIWLATNHKPIIRGTDKAVWRRPQLIPFDVTIPPEEQDKELGAKLRAEHPGILAWAVRGCQDWQHDGLREPAEVRAATDSYRNEMDVLGAFLSECCVLARHAHVTGKELYAAYVQWCEDNGERTLAQRLFGQRLRERGLESRPGHANKPTWYGIGLRSDYEDPDPEPDGGTGDAASGDPQSNGYKGYIGYQNEGFSSRGYETGKITPQNGNQTNQTNQHEAGDGAVRGGVKNSATSAPVPPKVGSEEWIEAPCPVDGKKHKLALRKGGSGVVCQKCQPELARGAEGR